MWSLQRVAYLLAASKAKPPKCFTAIIFSATRGDVFLAREV